LINESIPYHQHRALNIIGVSFPSLSEQPCLGEPSGQNHSSSVLFSQFC